MTVLQLCMYNCAPSVKYLPISLNTASTAEVTADKVLNVKVGSFAFLQDSQEKQRADERTQTADRLITSVRSVVAGYCRALQTPHNYAVFRSLYCHYCRVLRPG